MRDFRRIAFFVFLVGICAAAPFYKPAALTPPVPQPEADAARDVRREDLTLQVTTRSESSPAAEFVFPESSFAESIQETRVNPPTIRAHGASPSDSHFLRSPQRLESEPPPRIALRYEAVSPPPREPELAFSLAPEWGTAPTDPIKSRRSSHEADTSAPLRHRIVDGDTLKKLARKYLGDPARAREIFEANRGVLQDPDILPLGEELLIPISDEQHEGSWAADRENSTSPKETEELKEGERSRGTH
jgi:hypothetical protein